MAEQDWYPPRDWPRGPRWQALISLTAGLFCTISGIVGYDLGTRVANEVYTTRWMGRVIWGEILFGLALLGYAYYCYRKIRLAVSQRNSTNTA